MGKRSGIFFGLILVISMFPFINAGGGGGAVPITTIDLTEQGTDYNMKPGRLKFEFDEKLYAIQVRRVKPDYVWFLVMTLDMDKLDDITAYDIDDSFNLTISEKKEIDLNNDGLTDIFLELQGIGSIDNIGSASFSIKKINTQKSKAILSNESIEGNVEIAGGKIQEPIIVLEPESLEQPTFLNKIINFFKGLFR